MNPDKKIIIDSLLDRVNASPYLIVIDYTGLTAREWQDRWKRGEIEETPESFGLGMTSLTILAAEASEGATTAVSTA